MSSSSSEDEEEEEDSSDDESSIEESVASREEAPSSLESDVALIEEVCADMDAIFARLIMRYPPKRQSDGQRRDDDGDDDFFGQGRGGASGRRRQPPPPPPPAGGNDGPSGSRTTRFRRASDQMSTIHGAKRLSAPESERPPLSADSCEKLEDLAEEALAAFRRPDIEDGYNISQEEDSGDDEDPSLTWDPDNPEDVAEAIRELSIDFLGGASIDVGRDEQQEYLALSRKLERIDKEICARGVSLDAQWREDGLNTTSLRGP